MDDPLMQRGVIEIRQAQAARNRDRIALVDPEPEREGKGETSDEKAREDCKGEPIVPGVPPPAAWRRDQSHGGARRKRSGPLIRRTNGWRSPRPTNPDVPRRQCAAPASHCGDRRTRQSKSLPIRTFPSPWPPGSEPISRRTTAIAGAMRTAARFQVVSARGEKIQDGRRIRSHRIERLRGRFQA